MAEPIQRGRVLELLQQFIEMTRSTDLQWRANATSMINHVEALPRSLTTMAVRDFVPDILLALGDAPDVARVRAREAAHRALIALGGLPRRDPGG